MASEPVARRTRNSVRTVGSPYRSDQTLEAAVHTPLPSNGAAAVYSTPQPGGTDYKPLAQLPSKAEAKAAASEAAHAVAGAVQRAVDTLPHKYGPALLAGERETAGKLMLAVAAVWFLAILVGGLLHTEVVSSSEYKALRARLPLLWFDRALRRYGPLLPAPVLALRLAALRAGVPSAGQQEALAALQSAQAERQLKEAGAIYGGVTLLRLVVYWLHCAGVYLLLARAGMVSAAPLQLMSDHIFLGASLVAVLSAEAVLCAAQLRACRPSGRARALLLAGLGLAVAQLALLCGDMHFTARFFHERRETLLGAGLGLLAFQIPVTWWLLYGFSLG